MPDLNSKVKIAICNTLESHSGTLKRDKHVHKSSTRVRLSSVRTSSAGKPSLFHFIVSTEAFARDSEEANSRAESSCTFELYRRISAEDAWGVGALCVTRIAASCAALSSLPPQPGSPLLSGSTSACAPTKRR